MAGQHHEDATRATARVALVTCAELPDLDPDDRLLLAPLADRGLRADAVVWDDPAVDWSAYDLVVLRSPWDYVGRRDAFVAWAAGVPALVNPADVVAWNTDKHYLAELAAAGLPVVPTTWVAPDDAWPVPGTGGYVIKPVVGAGSLDAGRYDLGRPDERRLAEAHVDRLRAAGRTVMIQPYLAAVDTYGETALLFARGAYSHAIRKGPMLTGPDSVEPGLYRPEQITPRTPTEAERDVAGRVLAAVPGGADRLPYARVDLIPGPDGAPVLVELELTEPSLFLGTADGAPERFADAIASCVEVRSSPPPAPR
jgi:glutathione synthase/RimK-type ligase-like ATP-grasp enzyme